MKKNKIAAIALIVFLSGLLAIACGCANTGTDTGASGNGSGDGSSAAPGAPAAPTGLVLRTNIDENGVVSFPETIVALDAPTEDGTHARQEEAAKSPRAAGNIPQITAQWDTPESDTAALPEGYVVELYMADSNAASDAATAGSAGSAGADTGADAAGFTLVSTNDTTETSFTFDDLHYTTEYKVTVKAYVTDEQGNPSYSDEASDTITTGARFAEASTPGKTPAAEKPARTPRGPQAQAGN